MSNGAQGLGDAIKGAFNAAHGAGEVIRGKINEGADALGEGIANDGKTTGTDEKRQENLASEGHAPQDHSQTVSTGQSEFNQGLKSMGGQGTTD